MDMQAGVVSGPHTVPGTDQVLSPVAALARAFRDAGRPIVHLVRLYLPDGSNADRCRRAITASGDGMLVAGSPGTRLADGLIPDETAADRYAPDEYAPDEYAPDEHVPDGLAWPGRRGWPPDCCCPVRSSRWATASTSCTSRAGARSTRPRCSAISMIWA
ncbi:MAG TPA: hypothetical protein VGG75_04420 [Trebonia sp.]